MGSNPTLSARTKNKRLPPGAFFVFGGESRAPARPAGWDSKGWACKPSPPESPICRPQGGRLRAPRARAAKRADTNQLQYRLCYAVPIRGTGVSSVPRSPDCCPQGSPARRRRALQSPRLRKPNPAHKPQSGRRHADTEHQPAPTNHPIFIPIFSGFATKFCTLIIISLSELPSNPLIFLP